MSDQPVKILCENGLFFEREEDGTVAMEIPDWGIDCPGTTIEFTPDQWAGIIGFVSGNPDKSAAYHAAVKFHKGEQ